MNISDVLALYEKGEVESAYVAILPIYAENHDEDTSRLMFRVAFAVLERRLQDGVLDEASKVFRALLRLITRFGDEMSDERKALLKMAFRLSDIGVDIDFPACTQLLDGIIHNPDATLARHLQTGLWGEEVAAQYLLCYGYRIIERNWKSGHRDIDLIALDGITTVFVEVKTRSRNYLQEPELAVNYAKLVQLRKSMNHYVKYRRLNDDIRFDIVSVIGEPGQFPKMKHLKDVPVIVH